jgi:hypothetical protein
MPIIYPDLRLDYKVATHPQIVLEVLELATPWNPKITRA